MQCLGLRAALHLQRPASRPTSRKYIASARLESSRAQRGVPLPIARAWAGSQRCRRRRPPPVEANAAAAVAVADPYSDAQPASSFVWQGAKLLPLLASVLPGLVLRLLVPAPAAISTQGWNLLCLFVSTIAGLVLVPLPAGAWALLSVTIAVATKTLSFADAFAGFHDEAIWLIVAAFFFARGFEKTGLGERVANIFVRLFGKSTLGLAYGLSVAEAIVAPAMPSSTARAGGIFMPIIASLAHGGGSEPGEHKWDEKSRKKLGAYLVQSQLQAASHSSNMYLTAAAQNLLCVKLAGEMGYMVPNAFITWFKAALVPAWAGLLVTPLILYKLFPPEVKHTPEAPKAAEERLQRMGPMRASEKIVMCTLSGAVLLWVLGEKLGIPAVVTAMMGLSTLLLTGVLTWKDCLVYSSAWDTLFWFAILVGMSGQLNSQGVVQYFAGVVGQKLVALNLGWRSAFALLNAAYFLLHYGFAAQTAHVGALYPAFLAMQLTAGVPPIIAALSLGFMTNLFGAITHYSSGPAAVYYGSGYLSLLEVFEYGALMGALNLVVWGGLGGAWWTWLGLM
ncbi:hypothetical protein COHA_009016 [Chlorella ohadii]|uniref:Uncharacterized protein n=1 Tax=Chlorella ohadii TaxID=2649997 RepID=A0AAD5H114_9CHLO|nr:hypothetical protein COHA_009016 [Chlorella ohadii]